MSRLTLIFATRQPLRIAALRELLAAAGIAGEPRTFHPEQLRRALAGTRDCLVIIDGESATQVDALGWLRRVSPGSRIVIWADRLSTDLLLATLECDLDGLLSSHLPLEEGAEALARICRGERLMRFNCMAGTSAPGANGSLAAASRFDAQWMFHGLEARRGEK